MESKLLFLTLAIASVGFTVWYYLASSLRLPVRYQIMYDANPPYVNRIFRRRLNGFLIYAVIPIFIISCTNYVGRPSLLDLGISFNWNSEVMIYSLGGVVLSLLIAFFTTPRQTSLEQYPEVRVRFWRANILILSSLWWILFVAASEFFYHGLLLQAFRMNLHEDWISIAAVSGIYALTHYFRLNRLTFFSFIYSVGACLIVIHTGSLWPVIIFHITLTLFIEWLSIMHHREMYVRRT